jgi:hypothetical protein
MRFQLIGPAPLRPPAFTIEHTRTAAPVEQRAATRRAQRAIASIDRALGRTPCHWYSSQLYHVPASGCPACGERERILTREAVFGVPIEIRPVTILSVR